LNTDFDLKCRHRLSVSQFKAPGKNFLKKILNNVNVKEIIFIRIPKLGKVPFTTALLRNILGWSKQRN